MERMCGRGWWTIGLLAALGWLTVVNCGVPVLLWESSVVSEKEDVVPALIHLDKDEFSNHLVRKVHVQKPLVVLFLEESLSMEDFSWKDEMRKGAFPLIQNLTAMSAYTEFLTSVDEPLDALKDLTFSHGYTWTKFDLAKVPSKSGLILEVRLQDPAADEDRPALLRRHDSKVANIYSQLLAKYSHIVAIFTGRHSSWVVPESNRVRRQIENDTDAFLLQATSPKSSATAMISTKDPIEVTINGTSYQLTKEMLNGEVKADVRDKGQTFRLIAPFLVDNRKITLRFSFETREDESWKFVGVELGTPTENVVLEPAKPIMSPMMRSYDSQTPVEFTKGSYSVKFQNIQVQPWTSGLSFDDSDKPTVPYFTEAIWSGILISFLLIGILSFGLLMIMDIKTMDKFDDPKGKTITVNIND